MSTHTNTATGEVFDVDGNPLAKKIAGIIGKIKGVEKNGHNDFHNYGYATESDLLAAVRQHVADANIAIVPRVIAETFSVLPGQGKNKDEILTSCLVEFTVIDGDSGVREVGSYPGAGSDKLDKGGYKAMTGAEKYFLQKLFLIPTGDDPEKTSETSQNVRPLGGQARPAVQQPRPVPPPATGTTQPRPATQNASTTTNARPAPAAPAQPAPSTVHQTGTMQQRKADLQSAVANVQRPAAVTPPTATQIASTLDKAMATAGVAAPTMSEADDRPIIDIATIEPLGEKRSGSGAVKTVFRVLTVGQQKFAAFDAIGKQLYADWQNGKTRVAIDTESTQFGPKITGYALAV